MKKSILLAAILALILFALPSTASAAGIAGNIKAKRYTFTYVEGGRQYNCVFIRQANRRVSGTSLKFTGLNKAHMLSRHCLGKFDFKISGEVVLLFRNRISLSGVLMHPDDILYDGPIDITTPVDVSALHLRRKFITYGYSSPNAVQLIPPRLLKTPSTVVSPGLSYADTTFEVRPRVQGVRMVLKGRYVSSIWWRDRESLGI